MIDHKLTAILDKTLEGIWPGKPECEYMLSFREESLEAGMICSVADHVSRTRFRNNAIILGQIGIDISPCPGRCLFCSFGDGHTSFSEEHLSLDEIAQRARLFAQDGDLYALFLMTMHDYDYSRLLSVIQSIRTTLPPFVQVVVNMGDFDDAQAREMKACGVNGAYHVSRLREGSDTNLSPESRLQTIKSIKNAGLDWYYCCEPVGPEHTNRELVEQMFIGVDYGCFQHAAMRRVYIPGSPLAQNGQITELRLAQITAVVTMAALGSQETRSIAIHEPNLLGLRAGANSIYAESGANPRDLQKDTVNGRGLDVRDCKKMLYEAGFDHIVRGDQTLSTLDVLTSDLTRNTPNGVH